jgi:hypothetical protein
VEPASRTHGNLLVRHPIAHPSVEFVERFPCLFRVREVSSGRHGSLGRKVGWRGEHERSDVQARQNEAEWCSPATYSSRPVAQRKRNDNRSAHENSPACQSVYAPAKDDRRRFRGQVRAALPRTFHPEARVENLLRSFRRHYAYSLRARTRTRQGLAGQPPGTYALNPHRAAHTRRTHPRQVNMPRFQMQIHQIKRDPTLQIPGDPIDLNLPADVQNLAPRDIRFLDRLVDALVLLNPFSEIPLGFFLGHVLVIWIAGTSFESDVGGDDLGIVTP